MGQQLEQQARPGLSLTLLNLSLNTCPCHVARPEMGSLAHVARPEVDSLGHVVKPGKDHMMQPVQDCSLVHVVKNS